MALHEDEERGRLYSKGQEGDQDDKYNESEYFHSFPNHVSSHSHSTNTHTSDVENDEHDPLLSYSTEQGNLQVYKRRWYILLAYSVFSFTQNNVWNTWGPISTSAEAAFGWTDSTIAWMNNWGPISYILFGLFFPWLLQVKGLRWAVLSSSLIMAAGTTFRVFTDNPHTATILIHCGQFLNGVAGPVAMGAIPQLSATWFPPKERVTATALGTSISTFGAAVAFILGPKLVTSIPPSNHTTMAPHPNSTQHSYHLLTSDNDSWLDEDRDEIMRYMYYHCGFAWLITLAILCYFPGKPPSPPSMSANTERDSYWSGLWSLRNKRYFLILAFVYGVSLGVLNCWISVLNVNVKSFVSEDTAGWIGFYSTMSACIVSLMVGRFADYFARKMKLFIMLFYVMGTASFILFALVLENVVTYSDALLYVSVISGMTFLSAAIPLMFELACELAYPTSEGAANGILTYLNNLGGLIFLAILSIKGVGTMWMNWTVIGASGICIPLLCLMRGRFNRLEVDENVRPEKVLEQDVQVQASVPDKNR